MKFKPTSAWRQRIAKALPGDMPADQKSSLIQQIAKAIISYEDMALGDAMASGDTISDNKKLYDSIGRGEPRDAAIGPVETLAAAMDEHREKLRDLARLSKPLERQLEILMRRLESRHATPDLHSADGHLLALSRRAKRDLALWRELWSIRASGRPRSALAELATVIEACYTRAVGSSRGIEKLMRELKLPRDAARKRSFRKAGTNTPPK
jgi:hypothetical protein